MTIKTLNTRDDMVEGDYTVRNVPALDASKNESLKPAKYQMSRTHWALPPQFENVPPWLQALPWANWTAEPRGNGKMHKAPRHPNGGWKLSVTQPSQWASFGDVVHAYEAGNFDGIGILLTTACGLVGIDIDDWPTVLTAHDSITQTLVEFQRAGGHVELSPSGNGLRAFLRGTLGSTGRKSGGLEIYDNTRFLTVTGHVHKVKVRHD